jgi:hypothetical protein
MLEFFNSINWKEIVWWIGSSLGIFAGTYKIYDLLVNSIPNLDFEINYIQFRDKYSTHWPAYLEISGIIVNKGKVPVNIKEINLEFRLLKDEYDLVIEPQIMHQKIQPNSSVPTIIKFQQDTFNFKKLKKQGEIATLTMYDTFNKKRIQKKLTINQQNKYPYD